MMRALELDFVRRPRGLRRLAVGILLVGLAGAVVLGYQYRERSAVEQELASQWQGLRKIRSARPQSSALQKNEVERLQAELKFANRVIGHLSMPWDGLFREVEATMGDDVGLLNVAPDTEKLELHMTAEAKNLMAMVDYQKRLSGSAIFDDVYIASHQVQQQDPQKPVRFVINARWTDPGAIAVSRAVGQGPR